MATAKEIQQRIKSIKNTQKTTKAMELVSGAKMRKAVSAAQSTRNYHRIAWDIARGLRKKTKTDVEADSLRFFEEPKEEKFNTLILLFTSNRGLCGSFNTNAVKQITKYVQDHPKEKIQTVGIGKKGIAVMNSLGMKPELAYEKDDNAQTDESIREVAAHLYEQFKEKKVQKVMVVYTHFKSPLVQDAIIRPLYPLPMPETAEPAIKGEMLYTYEPSPAAVLDFLIPRIAEVELYQALLESNASEHSARMIAMKNATEAASEMKDDLTLEYNRARQAAITNEIAEIAAGTAAVS